MRNLLRAYPIARRLAPCFDGAALASDLLGLGDEWWHRHAGPYHDGGWESVSLWAPRGDPFEQRSFGGEFAGTPALAKSPALRATLDHFSSKRNRVRLMRLGPGNRILRHSDPLHAIDPGLVRLHIPVVTNAQVFFMVNDTRVEMKPGETWHVDVRFPHAVENRGSAARVHLVMDLVRDPALDRLLANGEPVGDGRLIGYFARHALPGSIRGALRLGN